MEEQNRIMKLFEDSKHIITIEDEYWFARDLMKILGYKKWYNFYPVIVNSKIVCSLSNHSVEENFKFITKKDYRSNKNYNDYMLSRFACYLIIQNADLNYKGTIFAKNYIIQKTIEYEETLPHIEEVWFD